MEELEESPVVVSNRKIKNATIVVYDGVSFKSKLEVNCYKKLKASGLRFEYEEKTLTLVQGFKLENGEYYAPQKERRTKLEKIEKKRKVMLFKSITRSLAPTTYTPDFYIYNSKIDIFIEAKGQVNDIYPLKKKLFLKWLEENARITGRRYIFFEPHNLKQMDSFINIIKTDFNE